MFEDIAVAEAVLPSSEGAGTDRCSFCRRIGADPRHRRLCLRCYLDGRIRSCFATTGERLRDPPPPEPEVVWDSSDDDGQAGDRQSDDSPPKRSRRHMALAQHQAVKAADDAAVLAAVDTLTARGQYADEAGQPAAALRLAGRIAGLAEGETVAAAARLVAAGQLSAVLVRTGSRTVKGARRPAGSPPATVPDVVITPDPAVPDPVIPDLVIEAGRRQVEHDEEDMLLAAVDELAASSPQAGAVTQAAAELTGLAPGDARAAAERLIARGTLEAINLHSEAGWPVKGIRRAPAEAGTS
jgi:hypothetical protein